MSDKNKNQNQSANVDKRHAMLQSATKYIQSECTGEIEPWAGRKGPMVTAFLKQNGSRPGPKGYKTVSEFVSKLLENLKGSSYYIRFRFNLPDGSGGTKQQLGTLISVNPDGNLTFACRERIQSQFTTSVDKVERQNVLAGISSDEETEESNQMSFDMSAISGVEA